jgi:putative membrane protein
VIEYDARSWATIPLMLRGSVLPRLVPRVLAAGAIGGLAWWVKLGWGYHLPAVTHTMLGVALGLLLVFRTNASYDRWWEGRRLIGLYTNRARDLARQIVAFVDGSIGSHRDELLRLVGVGYGVTRLELRRERDLVGLDLTPAERAALEDCPARPMRVHTWLGQALEAAIKGGAMPEQRLLVIDQNLSTISDAWGGAERIVRTPIPFAYAQHIKTFLVLFIFTAPFAVVDAMGVLTPVASALIAFALFGIDEIGVEIEDPFGNDANDLPLDRIGEVILRDLATARETRRPA